MNYYYITGTSRGIGKAMAEFLLKEKENTVIGIARSRSIEHRNYKHITLDLSDVSKVKGFQFEKHPDAKNIFLVNNAGAMGEVKPVGRLSNDTLIKDYNLNLVAPCLLMNNFIPAYKDSVAEKIILNISSGAGKYPIDGWSVYCASKAGLDLFSRVIDLEQKTTAKHGFHVFAIAPGVVETDMQTNIRKVPKEDFSRLDDFVNYKSTGQLLDPAVVAEKYFRILAHPSSLKDVVLSLRDL